MTIILFAIIGATINANVAYWIFYGLFCACKAVKLIVKLVADD